MSILSSILGYLNLQRIPTTTALVTTPRHLVGQWAKACDESGATIGYEHLCLCGETRRYSPNEFAVQKIHSCACGEFNLKESLAAGAIPTKLVNVKQDKETVQAVGDEPVNIRWSGRNDAAREKAFDAGDPGAMGPGF